jgi:hypothetical protein
VLVGHEVTITREGDHLHVLVRGDDSYELSLALWRRIAEACEAHQCFKVLGESDCEPMSTMDAYYHPRIFREVGITSKYRIAWVEKNRRSRSMIKFAETVLRNRSLPAGPVFEDAEEARRWLTGPEGE